MTRPARIKTLLWGIVGVLATVSVARFFFGLGATTGLSDAAPWGLWIAFDVMAGVALAAGGFLLAGTVYIFRLERFRPFVRPAVLTAFLGYAAVATGLLYDLGLPWHILNPIVFPQHHSVLFEVAMCVMLYLTVLFLEFSPAILEHPWFQRPLFQKVHQLVKRATIVLVIAGIVLSSLHQSSLGSLFLIAPHRVHPLWYSPIIWVLFLVSAMGLGLMMVVLESFFSGWLFGHRLRMDLLAGLGKAASVILFIYALLRVGDLALRGVLRSSFDGSFLSGLFVFELLLSAVVPAILLAIPRVRQRPGGLLTASLMTILGVVGYRFDVALVAFARPASTSYFPSWIEFAVSLGIVAAALLVFIFFAEHLRVFSTDHKEEAPDAADPPRPSFEPHFLWTYLPEPLAAPRRYSLAFIVGAALAIALLPSSVLQGAQVQPTPASPARDIFGAPIKRSPQHGDELLLVQTGTVPVAQTDRLQPLMVIDGNQDGRLVLFPHETHIAKLGLQGSCTLCHHQNLPYQRTSSCSACHRDMYSPSDIYNHATHVAKLGHNQSCQRCHQDSTTMKTRSSATSCLKCHPAMASKNPMIPAQKMNHQGFAASYLQAMHGMCIGCHRQKKKDRPAEFSADFAGCLHCHRDIDGKALTKLTPYTSAPQVTRPWSRTTGNKESMIHDN